MGDTLSIAAHVLPMRMLTSLSVNKILLLMKWYANFSGLQSNWDHYDPLYFNWDHLDHL